MDKLIIFTSFFAAFRMATPLVFASLGGYFSERAGIINIALEGLLLMGAFTSGAFTASFHNPFAGIFAAVLFSMLLSAVYAFLVIELKADQIIAGIAINLFSLGIPPVICKAIYDVSGGTPMLQANEKMPQIMGGSYFVWGMFIALILVHIIHSRTKFGQYVRFSGEHPLALISQGVSVRKIRWFAVLLSGLLCGLGGAYLAIDHGSGFTRSMTAGRGFIALAALIIGHWTPIGAFIASLVFGLIETSQIYLQGMQFSNGMVIPVQWIQMIPYIATLIILAGLFGKKLGVSKPPKYLGAPLAIILVLASSFLLQGCTFIEKVNPLIQKIFPNHEQPDPLMEDKQKKDDDYIAPPDDIRKVNAEFIKELYLDTLQRQPTTTESTNLMTVLDQGAHYEGVYNGIIYSEVYKVKENKLAGVSSIKYFAEIMAFIYFEKNSEIKNKNENINSDQELPSTVIPNSNSSNSKPIVISKDEYAKKIDEYKQEAVNNEYSFFTLKRILGEEILKTVDLKKSYKEKLATWYGKTVLLLNKYGIDFGIAQRNKSDETYHYRWALYNDEDRIKWELLHRVHTILNSSNH